MVYNDIVNMVPGSDAVRGVVCKTHKAAVAVLG